MLITNCHTVYIPKICKLHNTAIVRVSFEMPSSLYRIDIKHIFAYLCNHLGFDLLPLSYLLGFAL